MPRSNQTPPTIKDSEFLQKARDRFKYCLESWRDIREQHDLDMLFLAGDSWDEKEKQKRKRKNIPMIHLDELNQYLNQLNNDIRENKRAVKVMPIGGGATNTTAQNRSDWIRAVEYQSQAQSAYITAFEGATGGSYGFWKLETYYESPESFNLSVRICPIPNANTIVYDPDCKAYDCSDAEDCFEVEWISRDAFKRRFPGADYGGKSEFSDEIRKIAPEWISDKQVQIASWWRVKLEKVKLHLVKLPDGSTKVMREDHLPDNVTKEMILKTREHEDRRIVQYVINGVEVLETNDPSKGKGWPGKWIPIIPVWGKELFVDEGAGSERMLFSLIRLARDPQRLLNYYAAQELKEAKKTPDTPYMGPVGMFSNQAEQWESINEEGRAWVEYSTPDGYQPGSIKPERVPFVPNFQQYELAKEAARRHIMAAMGISPLPTAAQRQNEKSGIALERVEGERAQGSFHFIDNYQRSLEFSGRQLNDLFDVINDSARDIPMRKADGTHYLGRVNDSAARNNKEFKGEHEVTITTGPSHESQREEAADFADTLATVPGVFPLVGDLLVKMRNLGPIGDQLAARLIPPQFAGKDEDNPLPPEAQSAIGQLQTQIQQMQQLLQQLQQEKAAKMWEMDGKLQIEKIHSDTAKAVAEINTKAQILGERIAALEALQADFHAQAHDTALSAQEHQQTMQQQSQAAALTPPAASGNTPSNGAGGGS